MSRPITVLGVVLALASCAPDPEALAVNRTLETLQAAFSCDTETFIANVSLKEWAEYMAETRNCTPTEAEVFVRRASVDGNRARVELEYFTPDGVHWVTYRLEREDVQSEFMLDPRKGPLVLPPWIALDRIEARRYELADPEAHRQVAFSHARAGRMTPKQLRAKVAEYEASGLKAARDLGAS